MSRGRPARARIDLTALAHNFHVAERTAAGRRVIAVIKADAYGHGAAPVARRLVQAGCRQLAVLSLDEGCALRDAALRVPILLLGGPCDEAEAREAAARDLCPVLHHPGQLAWSSRAAARTGVPLGVQVEIDTGMRRMGVAAESAPAFFAALRDTPGLQLSGVMTHLARADEIDPAASREQLARFSALLAALAERGIEPGQVHVANSAALLAAASGSGPPLVGSAVRPGLMLYGVPPAPHLHPPGDTLRPVMTLSADVVATRRVAAGDAVGYGGDWRAPGPGRVATLALGYADGIPCSVARSGEVLLHGRRVPFAGRISMDFCCVWVGVGPVALGDKAVFFGATAEAELPVAESASRAGTLAYELLVRVGGRVPRVPEP